jgi:hypothetical protein
MGDDRRMRFLLSVIDDESTEATPGELAATNAYTERLRAAGRFVFVGGLAEPGAATVVDSRRGEPVFSDGPYVESKEYLGGFWVVDAHDLDEARGLAAEASRHCNRRVELRPFR